MKGQEVVLTDMLACRERRVNIQNKYIQRHKVFYQFFEVLHRLCCAHHDHR